MTEAPSDLLMDAIKALAMAGKPHLQGGQIRLDGRNGVGSWAVTLGCGWLNSRGSQHE